MSGARAALDHRKALDHKSSRVRSELFEHVADRGRLAVVQAPPGSGKTYLLLQTVKAAFDAHLRIAVATQTNAQADDICRRIASEHPTLHAHRLAATGADPEVYGGRVEWATSVRQVPAGRSVVIATAAKWGMITVDQPYDVCFVEEAWQLAWANFMLLGQVAERFVLIGDPGQISPVVTIETQRWETAPRAPHRAAPQVLLEDGKVSLERWDLPASRRLPADAVGLVKRFYDFDFEAWAQPGDRAVQAEKGGRSAEDRTIDLLASGSVAALTVPTPAGGPPLERDQELAEAAAKIAARLLARKATVKIDGSPRPLTADDVGLVATHRVMNAAMDLALPARLRGRVRVDTPERWQGLERPIMIAVHPLSGVLRPSSFDLETGRLCVMASRHKAGLIVLGRDHVGETLRNLVPLAEQPVGRPDVAGRGWADNLGFWEALEGAGRVVPGI